MGYRDSLFSNYRKTHNKFSGSAKNEADLFFKNYYDKYYKKIFKSVSKDANILEIGCNMGSVLKALWEEGYSNLTGIDLSDDDLNIARNKFPIRGGVELKCVDAFEWLSAKHEKYDVIYSRAVFEHIEKHKIIELMELCKESLSDKGIFIVEVPNMDWIWASHERYMDFTHEVGFTQESLGQLVRLVFGNAKIYFNDDSIRNVGLKGKIIRKFFAFLILNSEPYITKDALFHKCIMAVAKINNKEFR